MSSGGVLPGRDPSVRAEAEVVYESERTRVTRLFLSGRTVILKQPLGPDAERRVRHETSNLERLRGVAGVMQFAEAPRMRSRSCLTTLAAQAWRNWASRWRLLT